MTGGEEDVIDMGHCVDDVAMTSSEDDNAIAMGRHSDDVLDVEDATAMGRSSDEVAIEEEDEDTFVDIMTLDSDEVLSDPSRWWCHPTTPMVHDHNII